MKNIFLINKKEGETPLEALESFRAKNKKYKDVKMTYAGRLDPMASGLLLILADPETKNKEKHLSLDKEYEFNVLFGFATDTYDILGKVISKQSVEPTKKELEISIQKNIKHFSGKLIQQYPLYSSKTVDGKQLFEYGREGKAVRLPAHEVHVKSLNFLTLKNIARKKLLADVEKRIKKVKGDFRQKEIVKIWQKNLKNEEKTQNRFFVGCFKIKCSSGTYVRGIANSLGDKIGIPALAFSIKRTKIGKWGQVR